MFTANQQMSHRVSIIFVSTEGAFNSDVSSLEDSAVSFSFIYFLVHMILSTTLKLTSTAVKKSDK